MCKENVKKNWTIYLEFVIEAFSAIRDLKEFITGFSLSDIVDLVDCHTGRDFRCYPPCLTIPSFILTSFAAVPPQPSE